VAIGITRSRADVVFKNLVWAIVEEQHRSAHAAARSGAQGLHPDVLG